MRRALSPGDNVIYKRGERKLHATVADYLPMKTKGEEDQIPIILRKNARWVKRSELRKCP